MVKWQINTYLHEVFHLDIDNGNNTKSTIEIHLKNPLEKDIINFLNEIGEEFIKHYDIRNLVEDSVYVYNRDIDEMQKELNQIDNDIKKR